MKPTELEDGGKFIHFGLERALNCNSPGVLHKDANLLQFVRIYRENQSLLPITVREKGLKFIKYSRLCLNFNNV